MSDKTFDPIFQRFHEIAERYPERTALNFYQGEHLTSITYQHLAHCTIRLASLLMSRGLARGHRVAIVLPSGPAWPVAFMAIQHLGCVAIPIDATAKTDEIIQCLEHAGCETALCDASGCAQFAGRCSIKVLPFDIYQFLRIELERVTVPAFQPAEMGMDDLAAIFYTSGTTGTPKGVMLTHRNLLSNADAILKSCPLRPRDVLLSLLPLYHTYAFTGTLIIPLLCGAAISYPARISSKDIEQCMLKTSVSIFVGVPHIFNLIHSEIERKLAAFTGARAKAISVMLTVSSFLRRYLHINVAKMFMKTAHRKFGNHLRYFISGGAKIEVNVVNDFYKWGFGLLEGYGLTETSPIITFTSVGHYRPGSVGKPIKDVTIDIRNQDSEGIGEMYVKGPNVMKGYHKRPDLTSQVLVDGWFNTGDLARVDTSGYVYIVGRKDERIALSSGENIVPQEVENHYETSRFITEICVFASKGTGYFKQSDQLVSVIVPDYDEIQTRDKRVVSDIITRELDRLSQGIAEFNRIRGFVIRDEALPRTALGKIKRYQLQREYTTYARDSVFDKNHDLSDEDRALMLEPNCGKLIDFLSKRLSKDVHLNDHLELDLGLDSLGKVELLLEIQQLYAITVPETQLEDFFIVSTVRELYEKSKSFLA